MTTIRYVHLFMLALCAVPATFSFTTVTTTARTTVVYGTALHAKIIPESEDFASEEYTGSVDWDAEWKKVVEKGSAEAVSTTNRPGKGYYKSEAEIAAIRAANKATVTVTDVASKVPTWNDAKGDWKIWVGVLAAISIGVALLSAQTELPASNASPDTYYI